jgi:hypothetical protein
MLLALVTTNDPGLTQWQVHDAKCGDISALLRKGAFVLGDHPKAANGGSPESGQRS